METRQEHGRCPTCGESIEALSGSTCPRCMLRFALGLSSGSNPLNESSPAPVPEQAGRYSVIEKRGEGGMGRVYLARDSSLGRLVALKELAGPVPTDSKGEIPDPRVARFLREAQITAVLQHPSITPVYELGVREDGTLYYSMKLIEGRTLAQVIRDSNNLRDRLKLLPHVVDVCNAVAYAHSRGVVHRDIKPENVMIGNYAETLLVDWGLAKVTGDFEANDWTESEAVFFDATDPARTLPGSVLGTPAYMSPEQARGRNSELDARSDVYALGALLYTLLAGRAPFDGDSATDVLEKVLHRDPAPIESVITDVPAELKAICNRAMQRAPENRYQSAKELGDDLQRFMTGGYVAAFEYSPLGYLRRYVAQHKAPFAVAGAAAVVLLGLAAFSFWRIAEGRALALAERDRANAQRDLALEAIDRLTYEMPDKLKDVPLARSALLEMLESNVELLSRVIALNPDAQEARAQQTSSHAGIGERWLLLGDSQRAVEAFGGALALADSLEPESVSRPEALRLRAMTREGLARALTAQGEYDAAVATYDAARSQWHELLKEQPDDDAARIGIASACKHEAQLHTARNEFAKAIARLDQAREYLESMPENDRAHSQVTQLLAEVWDHLGTVHTERTDFDAARESKAQADKLWRALLETEPSRTEYLLAKAGTLHDLGFIEFRAGRIEEAIAYTTESTELAEQLLARDPLNTQLVEASIRFMNTQASSFRRARRFEEAMETHRRSIASAQSLVAKDSQNTTWLGLEAFAVQGLGIDLVNAGNASESLTALRDAESIYRSLLDGDPDNGYFMYEIGVNLMHQGLCYVKLEQVQHGVELMAAAFDLHCEAVTERGFSSLPKEEFRTLYGQLSGQYNRLKDVDKGVKLRVRYISVFEKLVESNPEDPRGKLDLATQHAAVAKFMEENGRADLAAGHYSKAIALWKSLRTEQNDPQAYAFEIMRAERAIGEQSQSLNTAPLN